MSKLSQQTIKQPASRFSAGFFACVCLIIISFLTISPVMAAEAVAKPAVSAEAVVKPAISFEHFSTGFPLEGAHKRVGCAECHLNAVFKDTLNKCVDCHGVGARETNKASRAKTKISETHIPASTECVACHNTDSWHDVRVNHDFVRGTCVSCHQGTIATGKDNNHIRSSSDCRSCHVTQMWTPASRVDHTQVMGVCSSCHDNITAQGKKPDHVMTTQECGVCHSTTAWLPVRGFDHTGITNGCSTSGCHSASDTGRNKPTDPLVHPASDNVCEACHIPNEPAPKWTD
ncbi:MAG: hypothetical protein H0W44_10400, partial [Gammaproteobacteria bacterium]|nr:hypothetical protein [Gammaproteobacteria bacterium]